MTNFEKYMKMIANEDRCGTLYFIRFLKKSGIFNTFIKRVNESISPPSAPEDISDFLSEAFIWGDSKDGHDFWCNFDIMWRHHIVNEVYGVLPYWSRRSFLK